MRRCTDQSQNQSAETMNSSQHIQNTVPSICVVYTFTGEKPDHFSTLAYAVLVFIIITHAMTFPFTIVLNSLVMIAVKTRARLQSMSNIALACLALTDLMVGVFVQPLYTPFLVALLNNETTGWACTLHTVTRFFVNFFCFASISHLFVMSADRYIGIKRPYSYLHTVTKTRINNDRFCRCMDLDFSHSRCIHH